MLARMEPGGGSGRISAHAGHSIGVGIRDSLTGASVESEEPL
jgi:hypothetical protein